MLVDALADANTKIEQTVQTAYQRGYEVGLSVGQAQGYQIALEQAQKALDQRTGAQEELDLMRHRLVH